MAVMSLLLLLFFGASKRKGEYHNMSTDMSCRQQVCMYGTCVSSSCSFIVNLRCLIPRFFFIFLLQLWMVRYNISFDGDTGSNVLPCLEIVLSPLQSERVKENTKCSIGNPNLHAERKRSLKLVVRGEFGARGRDKNRQKRTITEAGRPLSFAEWRQFFYDPTSTLNTFELQTYHLISLWDVVLGQKYIDEHQTWRWACLLPWKTAADQRSPSLSSARQPTVNEQVDYRSKGISSDILTKIPNYNLQPCLPFVCYVDIRYDKLCSVVLLYRSKKIK